MRNMTNADLVTWECTYTDGTVDRESDGKLYGGIDRNKFKSFRLVSPDGVNLFEAHLPPNFTGHQFVYRRRVSIINGAKWVIFLLGWYGGPAFAIDVETGQYRVKEDGFTEGDPDFYPPVPMAGEKWLNEVL